MSKPTFEEWSKNRTPNRNRYRRELVRLIHETAESLVSCLLGEPYDATRDILTEAKTAALRAEYEATFDTMFPETTERDLPAAYARAGKALVEDVKARAAASPIGHPLVPPEAFNP